MTTIEEIEINNKISQGELDIISNILLESFLVKSGHQSVSFIERKETLLNEFTAFLMKYMELHFINSPQQKLALINFIDKLNMQKELLELQKGNISMNDIKIAAQRLGKKSQSAFEGK